MKSDSQILTLFLAVAEDEMIWIGGTNDGSTVKADYYWQVNPNTKQPFAYANWAHTRPKHMTSPKRCVSLRPGHGHLWQDDDCSATYVYMCED